jgi:hypothetical protein
MVAPGDTVKQRIERGIALLNEVRFVQLEYFRDGSGNITPGNPSAGRVAGVMGLGGQRVGGVLDGFFQKIQQEHGFALVGGTARDHIVFRKTRALAPAYLAPA